MNLDLTSFAFGSALEQGTGTPSWGTSLGQSRPDYKFTYPGAEAIVVGMVYCSVPKEYVSLPLGRGGRTYNAAESNECQLASLFRKVYINDINIGRPFILVLTKELSASHSGRRSIKYSDKITYEDENEFLSNETFIKDAREILHLSKDACWFIYKFEIKNQDELHMYAVVVDEEDSVTYENSSIRRGEWLKLIENQENLNSGSKKDKSTSLIYSVKDLDLENLQVIYYGAPGTGKSFKVENEGTENDRIRTTFHPDSDYSTFVGCYKPQQDKDDPKRIVYKFEGQSFTKAYIEAWKRLICPQLGQSIKYTLVIEEINRGNCAQIFGDIFQLLDRNEKGFSRYGISPDEDLSSHLREKFENLKSEFDNAGFSTIADGTEMKLPPNLSILATMNTSDQSLFPIDSAFKRRWDWEYIPIQYKPKDEHGNTIANKIDIDGTIYDWGRFIKAVNDRIYSLTHSEDKQLGYFFVCPAKGEGITKQRFVSKVVFYLWSDIYKDYVGRNDSIFKFTEDGNEKNKVDHSFNSFFQDGEIKVSLVKSFIGQFEGVEDDGNDEDDESGSKRNQYLINGNGPFAGKELAFEAMKLYINNNPNKTPQEIVNEWNALGVSNSLVNNQTFVATTQFYRSKPVPCNGGSVWVTTYGWTFNPSPSCPTPTIPMLIQEINGEDWGINIEIIEQ